MRREAAWRWTRVGLLALGLAPASLAVAGPSPRVDYMLHCQGCHLADGRATPGKIPALAGSVGRFLSVPGGREYLVRVPGTAQAALGDAEIARLLNWILLEFDGRALLPDFRPYSADEVGALRRRPLVDPARVRRRLLESLERSP